MPSFVPMDKANLKGETVLLRADLNVPMQGGRVSDTTRIDRLKPTIDALVKSGAKTVILSHFGRPKGKDPEASLQQLLPSLTESWGVPVAFADDCIGPVAQDAVSKLQPGDVLLLENVRFYPGEEANDPEFTQQLAKLGTYYINDAFSAAHRAHASTAGLASYLPAAAGKLMSAELDALAAALESPERPVAAIVGGAKISTKLDLLMNLIAKVDFLILGGGMANTFLLARGTQVGKSLAETSMLDQANAIMQKAMENGCQIILPVDVVCSPQFAANQPTTTVSTDEIPQDQMILDVGPDSVANICDVLKGCPTLVWNGPLGAFETAPFEAGTVAVAKDVCDLVASGSLKAIAGGGDTVSALEMADAADKMTYVSTAGGAFLEWLEGKDLPGVLALERAALKNAA
jgi:phosphoglycerate kinase